MIKLQNKRIFIIVLILAVSTLTLVLLINVIKQRQTSTTHASENSFTPDEAINQVEGKNSLISDFPDFPVYPQAIIQESSMRREPIHSGKDLHAVWVTNDPVKPVMEWYLSELEKSGWQVTPPDDMESVGEQVAQLSKDSLVGYIGIELEEQHTEIVIDFRNNQ